MSCDGSECIALADGFAFIKRQILLVKHVA